MFFMQKITRGEAKALMQSQVRRIDFPALPETNTEKLFEVYTQLKQPLGPYVPETWTKASKCDRQFMVDLLCTRFPELMTDWAGDCRQQRADMRNQRVQRVEAMEMTQEWLDALAGAAYTSGKSQLPFAVSARFISRHCALFNFVWADDL